MLQKTSRGVDEPGNGEIWWLDSTSGVKIGQLNKWTETDKWGSQIFDISSYASGISGSSWTIGFKFIENTTTIDSFKLDKSTLSGEYTIAQTVAPVPEPGTMMLLGLGMFGMAVYGKRRTNREA